MLPKPLAVKIREQQPKQRGFGTRRVQATIGTTVWETSLFPDRASGSYFLPIKAAVRRAEELDIDDVVSGTITLLKG
jgi:hypothetical protein